MRVRVWELEWGAKPEDLIDQGDRDFDVLPRTGEFVIIHDVRWLYRVMRVVHGAVPRWPTETSIVVRRHYDQDEKEGAGSHIT